MNPSSTRPSLDDVTKLEENDNGKTDEKRPRRPRLVRLTRQSSFEASTDKAAAALVRRVLLAHQFNNNPQESEQQPASSNTACLDATLPSLTSSNEIDLQLYALIAIFIKDCVYSWYSKFTTDHTFIEDVIQIIAHCTRALEERLRTADLERLFLNEVPALIDAHVRTVRQCRVLAESHNSPSDIGKFYTLFRPHPALLPLPDPWDHVTLVSQSSNDAAYRQMLTEGIVVLLLPTEDLHNPCLRSIVTEVISDMMLGSLVSSRFCDGIFLYDTIKKMCVVSHTRKPWAIDHTVKPRLADRLAQYGLLDGDKQVGQQQFDFLATYSMLMEYLLLVFHFFCACIDTAIWIARLPRRASIAQEAHDSLNIASEPSGSVYAHQMRTGNTSNDDHRSPVLALRLWTTLATIVSMPERMPWLTGMTSLLQHLLLCGPGRMGRADSYMDRLMAHYILAPIFPMSKHLPNILASLRKSLFPNNSLPSGGATVPAGTNPRAQKRQARRSAAFAILNAIPASVAKTFYSPSVDFTTSDEEHEAQAVEQMVSAIEGDILAPFGEDDYVMRHLMYAIIDRIVVEVFPELGTQTVSELLAEREMKSGSRHEEHVASDTLL